MLSKQNTLMVAETILLYSDMDESHRLVPEPFPTLIPAALAASWQHDSVMRKCKSTQQTPSLLPS